MQYILPPIATWCVGQACSMASLLLAAGAPGMRHSLPNARIMIHQPSGGVQVSTLNGLLTVSDKVGQIAVPQFLYRIFFWMSKELTCGMFLLNMSESNLQCVGLMDYVCHMSQRNFANKIVIYCQPLQQSLVESEVASVCFSFSIVSWSVWYTALRYQMLSISHFCTVKCSSVQKVLFSFMSFFHICHCFFWYDIGNIQDGAKYSPYFQ